MDMPIMFSEKGEALHTPKPDGYVEKSAFSTRIINALEKKAVLVPFTEQRFLPHKLSHYYI